MSVRIYQLSKEIGVDNSELIQILRSRGHEVKSASSTVDNISADSLRAEYSAKKSAQNVKPEAPKAPQIPVRPEIAKVTADSRAKEIRVGEHAPKSEANSAQAPALPPQPSKVFMPVRAPGMAPFVPAHVPPPVAQPRGGHYAGPPSRDVNPALHNAPSIASSIAAAISKSARREASSTVRPPAPAQDRSVARDQPSEPHEPTTPQPEIHAPSPTPAPTLRAPAIPPRPQALSRPPQISPRISAPPAPPTMPKAPAPTSAATPEKLSVTPEIAAKPASESKGRVLVIKPPIVVRDFAVQIGLKPFQLISELMEMNIFASMNQILDVEIAKKIADRHGIELDIRHRGETQGAPEAVKEPPPPVKKAKLDPRPPVVCILGHVDHGKTTLLDTIRKAHVAAGEAGGITQHIGAYQIVHNDRKITFIDTPGHAAFSNMRARGANVTDIAVLVVAADDGFMPQTDEALGHARLAKVPIVVAINKMDMPGADVEKVRRQLQERGLTPEEWGGDTLAIPVSALKGTGVAQLLDAILLQAEITEGIEADYKGSPEGVVLEAQKEQGVGPTASAIIKVGTLRRGDALVCGPHYCRVRTLIDDTGKQIKEATPGQPVKIVGWASTPEAGDSFHTVANERVAKEEAEENQHRLKLEQVHAETDTQRGPANIDDLFAAIEHSHVKTFQVVVKADVYGTAEALAASLQQIKSEKIHLEVVEMGVGAISQNDILMASAAKASIVGFSVNLENGAAPFAKHHNIRIFQHDIIYELIDQVKEAMRDELPPETRENKIGAAEVRQVFPLSKGVVAGSMVTEGRVARSAAICRLMRKTQIVHEGKMSALRRFKDDASEVRAGYECGIQLENFDDYQVGDIIECYEILKIKPQL
jgi:translation initiation factor IF-2